MVGAGLVVVPAPGWVRERIVGVVDLLKFTSTLTTLWGVGGDAVRMAFQGSAALLVSLILFIHTMGKLPFIGIADLLLACI